MSNRSELPSEYEPIYNFDSDQDEADNEEETTYESRQISKRLVERIEQSTGALRVLEQVRKNIYDDISEEANPSEVFKEQDTNSTSTSYLETPSTSFRHAPSDYDHPKDIHELRLKYPNNEIITTITGRESYIPNALLARINMMILGCTTIKKLNEETKSISKYIQGIIDMRMLANNEQLEDIMKVLNNDVKSINRSTSVMESSSASLVEATTKFQQSFAGMISEMTSMMSKMKDLHSPMVTMPSQNEIFLPVCLGRVRVIIGSPNTIKWAIARESVTPRVQEICTRISNILKVMHISEIRYIKESSFAKLFSDYISKCDLNPEEIDKQKVLKYD